MQGLEQRVKELENQLDEIKNNVPDDQLSIMVFSGDLDHILAAFIIAVGAAVMYERVVMFFAFWGLSSLRDAKKKVKKRDFLAKMFGWMLPKGPAKLQLSKMNMAGIGTKIMKGLMKKKGVMSLEDLMKTAADSGVEIIVFEMAMDVMGFDMKELIDYPNITVAGVAKFLQEVDRSKATLFI